MVNTFSHSLMTPYKCVHSLYVSSYTVARDISTNFLPYTTPQLSFVSLFMQYLY